MKNLQWQLHFCLSIITWLWWKYEVLFHRMPTPQLFSQFFHVVGDGSGNSLQDNGKQSGSKAEAAFGVDVVHDLPESVRHRQSSDPPTACNQPNMAPLQLMVAHQTCDNDIQPIKTVQTKMYDSVHPAVSNARGVIQSLCPNQILPSMSDVLPRCSLSTSLPAQGNPGALIKSSPLSSPEIVIPSTVVPGPCSRGQFPSVTSIPVCSSISSMETTSYQNNASSSVHEEQFTQNTLNVCSYDKTVQPEVTTNNQYTPAVATPLVSASLSCSAMSAQESSSTRQSDGIATVQPILAQQPTINAECFPINKVLPIIKFEHSH